MPTDTATLAARGAGSARECAPATDRFSWWLWPHLLSLDAPLVAVVWQFWWAKSVPVALPRHAAWILGLGVWMIYLADRLADTAAGHPEIPSTLRHAFHARWRSALLPLALLCATALVLTTPTLLARGVFLKGMVLLSFASAYYWLVHHRRFRAWQSLVPKEAVVGAIFAFGTAFFPWCHGGMARFDTVLATILFGGLCACNCALITRWESDAQDLADPVSLLNAFPRVTRCLGLIPLAHAGVAGCLLLAGYPPMFTPILASGALLASLDSLRNRVSVPALRVLVDAALLTPLVAQLFLP